MLVEINVTNQDIAYSESILLKDGQTFDDERVQYIKDFTTLDLHAVPGSGKTTALLAKLVILEKYLPFDDGSGVLVLSHTNVAIDEIKHRIGKHCPKLFSYPNFIGTIQSFVDNYLAIPFYCNKFKQKTFRIDNEIYYESVNKRFGFNIGGFSNQEQKNARYYLQGSKSLYTYRLDYVDGRVRAVKGVEGSLLNIRRPRGNDWNTAEKSRVEEWLINFKTKLLKETGVLHFDDAYFLAKYSIAKNPEIVKVIRSRFQLIFVDEMQDMDVHQHDLLEDLFNSDNCIFQRIGDKNQAIYNGTVKLENVWSDRANILRISGSHRLTSNCAEVVKSFAVERAEDFELNGFRVGDIKPHIILFQDDTIEQVIPKFTEIINGFVQSGQINIDEYSKFKAIGWVKEHEIQENLGIRNYHTEFSTSAASKRIDFTCLKEYLLYSDTSHGTLKPIQNNIIRAMLLIMRLEGINTEERRYFTKVQLLNFFSAFHPREYNTLRTNLYKWSMQLVQGKANETWNEIKAYIPEFLQVFNKTVTESNNFINTDIDELVTNDVAPNVISENGINVEINTIHSVKGQTNTATLYLETYFQKDGTGEDTKSYESQRLAKQFLFEELPSNAKTRTKQSAKMAYVGLSRPTDLLCVAIHQDRFNSYLTKIDPLKWELIDLSINSTDI